MDVRVISWRYENIRGGLSGLNVNLGNPPKRWTLIQMPNGMGKTTTMHLFRAAFSGEQLEPEIVRSFKPTDEVKTGEFELVVTVGGQTYRITLALNYDAGTLSYHTARATAKSGGKEVGHVFPTELKSLLTPEFTKLFIFDGELARQIRDLKRDRASNAIRALYRLDKLREMSTQIDRLVLEEQQRSSAKTKAQTRQGLKALRTRMENARDKLSNLIKQQENLASMVEKAGERHKELENLIHEHMAQHNDFSERVSKLEKERAAVASRLLQMSKTTLSELRNPAAIHPRVIQRLSELSQKMQQLKLPKTMSMEFFYELAEQPRCVCKRDIGPAEKEAILTCANDYLSEDQIGVVNAIKSAVRQFDTDGSIFSKRAKQLQSQIQEKQRLNGEWDRLQSERVEAGDEELEELISNKKDIEIEIEENTDKLDSLTCTDPALQRSYGVDENNNIPLCRANLNERMNALAEATGTVAFQKKAWRTKKLVQQIENRALDLIKYRLRDATNEKLKHFIPSEAIRVARIGGALELEADHLSSKQQVSEGQSLAIAYAFLTSLFEQAPYRLPFIVDSPAGSLDLEVRREVAELIPDLFDQMIMFVISSEREGFGDPFYTRDGVRFFTVWRDDSRITHICDELEFFKQFHSEDK